MFNRYSDTRDAYSAWLFEGRGKKSHFSFFRFHADTSLFAVIINFVRLWPDNWFTQINVNPAWLSSFQSTTLPFLNILFTLSSICPKEIFLSFWSHPLFPVFLSVSAALNISVHLLSPVGLTQIMLRAFLWLSMYWLCVSVISPLTSICSLPLFFCPICFYFSDELIAPLLLNN